MNSIIECEKCRVDRIEEVYLGNQEEMIHELLVDFDKENYKEQKESECFLFCVRIFVCFA